MFETPRVRRRLSEAEEAIEKIEGQFKALELDWTNTYAKLLTIVQRISKQAQRVEQLSGVTQTEEGTPGPPSTMSRVERLQAEILARRAKVNGGS